jgi:type 1 fimbria pilin
MKKLALVIALAALGIQGAQATDLATGRLRFTGQLVQSGCSISDAASGGGDIEVAMPGALGIERVRALTGASGWNGLDAAAKSSTHAGAFALSISCPSGASGGIYGYVASMVAPASLRPTVKASWPERARLYFYGQGNGASGFISSAVSGSSVGVLAADASAGNQTVGIAVQHLNASGGAVLIDLRPESAASGVAVSPVWRDDGTAVKASPTFDFAYVPAARAAAVASGVSTATLPFKFEYR